MFYKNLRADYNVLVASTIPESSFKMSIDGRAKNPRQALDFHQKFIFIKINNFELRSRCNIVYKKILFHIYG